MLKLYIYFNISVFVGFIIWTDMCCILRIVSLTYFYIKKLYFPWNQNLNNIVKKQTDPESATIHPLGLKSKNHSKHHCPWLSSQSTTHNSSFSNTTLQTFTVISTHFQIFLFQVLDTRKYSWYFRRLSRKLLCTTWPQNLEENTWWLQLLSFFILSLLTTLWGTLLKWEDIIVTLYPWYLSFSNTATFSKICIHDLRV